MGTTDARAATKRPRPRATTRATGRSRSLSSIEQSAVRQRLLDAAYTSMSANGFETSGVADIIKVAGVGVGSFYNHFNGKEELARAVFAHRVEEFGRELEIVARHADDIVAATCFVYRRLIERAENDRAWASFILQLEPLFRMFDSLMRPHARVGLGIGIANGAFLIEDLESAITAIHAMMLASVQAMLSSRLSRRSAHRSSLYALRMFGVPEARAQALSRMSMASLGKAASLCPAGPRQSRRSRGGE